MYILNQNHKNFIISSKKVFRFTPTLTSNNQGGIIFLGGYFQNTFNRYTINSRPLASGQYTVKVVSFDDCDNFSLNAEGTISIAQKLHPPQNITITDIVNNTVTISWEAPTVSAELITGYKVYGNGGNGLIDRTNALISCLANVRSAEVTVANGNWLFIVESTSANSESINWFAVEVTLPESSVVPEPVATIDTASSVTLNNVNVGCCRIRFICLDMNTAYFNIYSDSASGTIDWDNPIARFAKQDGDYQDYTTQQLCYTENTTYKIGIRAETEYGTIENNTTEYSVTLDGIRPEPVTSLTLEV
jgi:hypothetical protein